MKEKQKIIEIRPVLYISQPKFKLAPLSMQDHFISKSSPKEKVVLAGEHQLSALSKEVIDENDALKEKEKKNQKNSKRSSVDEKVNFFKEIPNNLSQKTCEIVTENQIYIGKIISFEEKLITILPLTGTETLQVNIEEVKDICLI